ncbi:MAG: MBL fold metallo-hydrolase, partial [SAR324 cluster bacterium]|nr:MBL fold metallo-hydrolase [SAR324 cluster bacterium]
VKMTFYGNQHFRFVSTTGKVILINPWIKGNKDASISIDDYKRTGVDLILPTSGHGDDQGNATEIAAKTGAKIFVLAELGSIMQADINKFGGSPKQVYRAAISGRYKLGDVTVQMLHAVHGAGAKPPKGHPGPLYGGFGTGFLITFENGLKVLMAGSTGLTLDLQLFGMRYKPHIAMIPIMGRFMMHPDDAAYAAKFLMTDNQNLKTVIPQHFRVKGARPWMGTPAQFADEIKKLGLPLKVLVPQVGKEVVLRK